MASVALFSSVLAYIFWNRGVEQVGAQVAGLLVHLMPVFGVVLAWLFLGERLALFHIAGITLILTGIWITSRRGPVPAPAGTDWARGTKLRRIRGRGSRPPPRDLRREPVTARRRTAQRSDPVLPAA
jgi:hypothetical protein